MPVFIFATALAQSQDWFRLALSFFIIHFLVYPASNGYNSYFDKDEDSIGGLENPPPVSKELLYVSLILDFLASLLGLLVNFWFALAITVYGLVSKAYSNDKIRLKKYPFLSWLVIGFFQGAFTLWLVYQGVGSFSLETVFENKIIFAGILSSAILLGSYPMTQVYQHEEDARRGDLTISRILGIRGTFLFTMIAFLSAGLGYALFFWSYYSFEMAIIFQLSLLPVIIYFLYWFWQVLYDIKKADFRSTMCLNLISAICMNLFFTFLWIFG